jgi:hypothetical protein
MKPLVPLEKAACTGHATTMDGQTMEDIVTALRLCSECPVIVECRAWVHNNARGYHGGQGFQGVIGGRIYGDARKVLHRSIKKPRKRAA